MVMNFTGIALIAACVSIITQKHVKLACQLLAAMLGVFMVGTQMPKLMGGDSTGMGNIFKDPSLIGAALSYSVFLGRSD